MGDTNCRSVPVPVKFNLQVRCVPHAFVPDAFSYVLSSAVEKSLLESLKPEAENPKLNLPLSFWDAWSREARD
jgi:hypothetical protein